EGLVEVQDEGSQILAELVGARPGDRVADFCAGAGGKTLAIAAAMRNKGTLVATDTLPGRLERARLRFRRAGVHNVTTRSLSSARDKWVKGHRGDFDRVLVDAPCSGVGAWRRNPDARWNRLGPDLAELIALQADILDSAERLVRPGGRLVYATCSLLPEENEAQAERFLAAHPEFRLCPLPAVWAETLGGPPPVEGTCLRLTPARHGTDGFFAAIFERVADGVPGEDG
ncbi:MAG: RsmB/NOP family class I SAM-dependent RNA methyltransferase, partial [Alphaproteobacteria bacterium]|nr:RsmB/NOP family class I SAM-dependent RNA methyltransferase [Alphaproteobacteria bacterium]